MEKRTQHLIMLNKSRIGQPLSIEHRESISLANKGKKISKEHFIKLREGLKKYHDKRRKPKVCKFCQKEFFNKNYKPKFCSKKCEGKHNRGSGNPNWKGGKFLEKRPRESIK